MKNKDLTVEKIRVELESFRLQDTLPRHIQEEITREFQYKSPDYVEFLLNEIDRLKNGTGN